MSQPIEYEMRCIQCGYNLYLGCFGDSCPECGALNLMSAISAVERADRFAAYGLQVRDRRALLHRREAVELVWHAYLFACECRRAPHDPPIAPGSLTIAPDVWCKALRDDAVLQWSGRAGTFLERLGIQTSEDVGLIAAGLERSRMLRADGETDINAFSGCCVYATLPASLA